jgi:phosphoadenosine phosphosulfate reductase
LLSNATTETFMDTDLKQAPAASWLEAATPQEILRWAVTTYKDKLTMATAFGAEGCVILDMLAKVRDETGLFPDIFNLDTGYQFGQTLALKAQIEKKYGVHIRAVSPNSGIVAAEARSKAEDAVPLYRSNPNECCYWRKVVPLKDALVGFEAWITAIRRDQTPERASAAIVGADKQYPLVKINPLATWTKDMVWDYIRANEVPYNILHDQNFPSIGCWPCTRPVAPDQDDRAGRWAGTDKRECGIHLTPLSPR